MDGGLEDQGSQNLPLLNIEMVAAPPIGDANAATNVPIAAPNAPPEDITGDALPGRDHDHLVPMSNVVRIMRKVLPTYAKISEDAKETVQECVSEYINFITSEANDRCKHEQRKTVTADDILWAMRKLGFDDYVEPLTLYLRRYREVEGERRGSLRRDPLTPLRRSYAEVSSSSAAPAPPPGQAQESSSEMAQLAQLPQGLYPDGATGYYRDVYGDGSGAGSSSSSQGNLLGGGFDPYASFK